MSSECPPGTTEVAAIGRRTPMVLSVARCLREGLGRGASVSPLDNPVSVLLRSATDAQSAYLTFTPGRVTVAADETVAPDITWTVQWTDPAIGTDDFEGGSAELSGFAKEVAHMLSARDVTWCDAAQDFWTRVHELAGVPNPLRITCSDDSNGLVFGNAGAKSDGFLLHGTAAALVRVLEGRSLISDELAAGEVTIDGGLADFSGLVGANIRVVCGEL